MKLFVKTLMIICVTIIALTAVTYFFSQNLLVQSSIVSDDASAKASMSLARSMINESTEELGFLVKSYSIWDDTYEFMGDSEETARIDYINVNMNLTALQTEDTDLRVLIDDRGKIKYGTIYYNESGTTGNVPADIDAYLRPDSELIFPADADSSDIVSGTIVLDNQSYLISAAPIFPTNASGPARGTLLFGKRVDQDMIDQLKISTNIDLAIASFGKDLPPEDFLDAGKVINSTAGTAILERNDSWLGAYSLIEDINGAPAFMIRTQVHRTMYHQAREASIGLVILQAGASLFICTAILILLDRTVLRRLNKMGRELLQIGKKGEINTSIPLEGNDELQALAANINDMLGSLRDSQQQLLKSESKYRSLFDNMPGGCAYIKILRSADSEPIDFVIRDLNDRVEEILGKPKIELIGKKFREVTRIRVDGMFKELGDHTRDLTNSTGFTWDVYDEMHDKWLNIKLFPADADNYVLIFDDITERKRREYAQRENEKRIASLADEMGYIVWRLDDKGTIQSVDHAGSKSIGYEPDSLTGQFIFDYMHPDDRLATMIACGRVISSGKESEREFRLRCLNGEYRWMQAVISPAWDAKGNATGTTIQGRDITEKKRSQELLRESEEKFRNVVEQSLEGFMLIDETGTIIEYNRALEKIYGYPPEEVVGKKLWENVYQMLPEEAAKNVTLDIMRKGIEKMLKTGKIPASKKGHREIRIRCKDGTCRYIHSIDFPISTTRGFMIGNMIRDVTEWKLAEDALRANEADLALAQSIAHLGSCHIDTESNRINISEEFSRIFGLDPKKGEGSYDKFIEIVHPEDRAAIEQLDGMLFQQGGTASTEFKIVRPDGTLRTIYCVSRVTKNEKGQPTQFFRIVQDITERKNAEARVLASLKEKEILLKEIHHRVKNNLQIISSLLSLQSSYLKDNEMVHVFNESRDRVRSMAFIHEMLYKSQDFNRIEFLKYAATLTGSLFASYNQHQGRVTYRIEGENADLTIEEGVPCGLIINELISNSLKYAFPGDSRGEIVIDIRQEKKNFTLTVSDNGVGLPPDFDLSKSNTLGLQLVTMLVDQLEGTLQIDRGSGTKYTIKFTRK
ncbi:PAS domain S-box protein [Methanocella sp. MCL-LM]|uniref:PAS domain S-box protein n=1 Tax=Methanocella sp. MCL-LM TaxID=3412035 RepID=UPI003C72159B